MDLSFSLKCIDFENFNNCNFRPSGTTFQRAMSQRPAKFSTLSRQRWDLILSESFWISLRPGLAQRNCLLAFLQARCHHWNTRRYSSTPYRYAREGWWEEPLISDLSNQFYLFIFSKVTPFWICLFRESSPQPKFTWACSNAMVVLGISTVCATLRPWYVTDILIS